MAKLESEDYQGAIVDYTKALEINPQNADNHFNRASAKLELEDYPGAINAYTNGLEINPDDADDYYSRGMSNIESSDPKMPVLLLRKRHLLATRILLSG